MSLATAVRSFVIRRFASSEVMLRARQKAERRRQQRGLPHEVHYFHQVDDPYSQLAAQGLAGFAARYEVLLRPQVVAGASDAAIHDPVLWQAWARRECALMAPHLGLSFTDSGHQPPAELVATAQRILLAQQASPDFAEVAVAVGRALQAEDGSTLAALAAQCGAAAASADLSAQLTANAALRHRLGHYLSAMFYYAGEWYWGVDRLHYLEQRLDQLGARRPNAPAGHTVHRRPPAPAGGGKGARQTLEFYASLRSPYTHLSYARIAELCQRYAITLVVRPVIPMMMRGVKAGRRKGRYIIFDTAREARDLGIAFGKVWDPFGKPVLRAYSLFPFARAQSRGFEYLHEYSKAVWSEQLNAWSQAGLQKIVERAGLNWQQALAHLDQPGWQPEIEANAEQMIAAGSWGVPSFRLLADGHNEELMLWGQDRLWLLEAELARRSGGQVFID